MDQRAFLIGLDRIFVTLVTRCERGQVMRIAIANSFRRKAIDDLAVRLLELKENEEVLPDRLAVVDLASERDERVEVADSNLAVTGPGIESLSSQVLRHCGDLLVKLSPVIPLFRRTRLSVNRTQREQGGADSSYEQRRSFQGMLCRVKLASVA